MERFHFFDFRRRAPTVTRWSLRIALTVAACSALALLVLLGWSTGNASRYAQQYDTLLVLNGVLAVALVSWVVVLAARLANQVRKRQFGARLTGRFALYFALIGVVPGALIYVLSVQFMSRSIESWFNVRVDSALEAGLNLGRAALDSQLESLNSRARDMAARLSNASDSDISLAITRLREAGDVSEAMVFTGNGRLVAFSSSAYGQLLPDMPPPNVMNQLRVSRYYSAAEADELHDASSANVPAATGLHLRVVVPISMPERLAYPVASGCGGGAGTDSTQRQPGAARLPRLSGACAVAARAAQAVWHYPDAGADSGRVCRHGRGTGSIAQAGAPAAVAGGWHASCGRGRLSAAA
jgi:hypothetical protein